MIFKITRKMIDERSMITTIWRISYRDCKYAIKSSNIDAMGISNRYNRFFYWSPLGDP